MTEEGGEASRLRLMEDMQAIQAAALGAVDPGTAVRRWMVKEGSLINFGAVAWDLRADNLPESNGRIYLVGIGKAAPAMAQAAAELFGDRLSAGIVITRYGHAAGYFLPEQVKCFEAGHPVPDENGQVAAHEIVELLAQTTPLDRVLVLLSGGASALAPCPVPAVTLADLQQLTTLLLHSGAAIGEINTIRKHLDQIKGGQLARLAAPALVVSLILSDVVGDPLEVIASGPTAPDPSTYAQAWAVLDKYALIDQLPDSILTWLRAGLAGQHAETPKPGDRLFNQVTNLVIGSNRQAAQAALVQAAQLGYHGLLLSTFVEGEAREIGKVIAGLVKGMVFHGDPLSPPACLVLGGETTVTLSGTGKGGRNQELALATALGIEGIENILVMCLATDGSDGPTDAAGAIVDGQTAAAIRRKGMDAAAALVQHNSYPTLQAAGGLILIGPSGTNVNDLVVILAR